MWNYLWKIPCVWSCGTDMWPVGEILIFLRTSVPTVREIVESLASKNFRLSQIYLIFFVLKVYAQNINPPQIKITVYWAFFQRWNIFFKEGKPVISCSVWVEFSAKNLWFHEHVISLALGSETQINSMQCRYNPNSPKQDRKSLGEPLYVARHRPRCTKQYGNIVIMALVSTSADTNCVGRWVDSGVAKWHFWHDF